MKVSTFISFVLVLAFATIALAKPGGRKGRRKPICPAGYRLNKKVDPIMCINRTTFPVKSKAECLTRRRRRCVEFDECPAGTITKGEGRKQKCLSCAVSGATPTANGDGDLRCPDDGAGDVTPTCAEGFTLSGKKCIAEV